MTQGSSIYEVRMFREKGYVRRKCRYCGEFFWSLKEREDCGDAPCSDYTFFELSKSLPSLTVSEARDRFIDFFKRKGHEVIDPYPVVARWRDDLYLTIASIILFQPHVTSGLVPPPANPLVVAQPCVRLEDIDSVGYTFGRHLTSFIMGGHHAFNYPDRKVYFTDETVEYATEFFTKEIGIPEEELVFKESWWEGGGNAGPSFEVTAGGLELATLVFMMYEVGGGSKREMPLKIVDTGYGIERIAWFTQGVPTAFHAIYGDLVSKYHSILNVPEPPKDLLRAAVKHAGRLNPKDLLKYEELKKVVSLETGFDTLSVGKYLDGAVKVYALLDHVKTASLMLADGIVPSNTGEGYLVRLVLRRIFRLLSSLGALDRIYELFNVQSKHWIHLYPQIDRSMTYITDVLDVEVGKFKNLLKKAPSIVRKYLRKGSKGLSEEELIQLYDSHGIPPELVKELAIKEGVEIVVPPDFYFKVASKHSKAPIRKGEKSKLPPDVVKETSNLPPTNLLFHEDPYLKEFRARVQGVIKGKYLVLDRTAFYPEGGGQAGDSGELEISSRKIRVNVTDTQKVGDVVIHVLSRTVPQDITGDEVIGRIDWGRRFSLMRHHTATHILLGSARRVLGEHVWQAGAEKTPFKARLDITHYKPLSREEVLKIEDLVNKVIDEGRRVTSQYIPKYEAERKYGFRLYEGGVILKPVIRVVEVEGLDTEACFGTHVKNTRDVGAFKIIKVDRIADGVVRFEYVAGTQVARYAGEIESRLRKVSEVLGGEPTQKATSLLKELSGLRKKVSKLQTLLNERVEEEILASAVEVDSVKVSIREISYIDEKDLRDIIQRIVKKVPNLLVAALIPDKKGYRVEISAGEVAAAKINAKDLLKKVFNELPGSGGGKADHASGFLRLLQPETFKEALVSAAKKALQKGG